MLVHFYHSTGKKGRREGGREEGRVGGREEGGERKGGRGKREGGREGGEGGKEEREGRRRGRDGGEGRNNYTPPFALYSYSSPLVEMADILCHAIARVRQWLYF